MSELVFLNEFFIINERMGLGLIGKLFFRNANVTDTIKYCRIYNIFKLIKCIMKLQLNLFLKIIMKQVDIYIKKMYVVKSLMFNKCF